MMDRLRSHLVWGWMIYTNSGDMIPREVKVTYNDEVMRLSITDVNLMLKILVDKDGGKLIFAICTL